MSQKLHHVDSARYGCFTPDSLDFLLGCVRDANEVLFESEVLSARDIIVVARAVCETEQMFTQDPAKLLEPTLSAGSDWTLACVADALADAVSDLKARGRSDAAQRARAELRTVLERIANSPQRSPAVSYTRALSALLYEFPSEGPLERLSLLRLAIVENLAGSTQSNVIDLLCEEAECYVQLGMADLALHVYRLLVCFDPTSIPIHQRIVMGLRRDAPEVALAAAERALLLVPRDDEHGVRPHLRRAIEELRGQTSANPSSFARALLAELTTKPGKKARIALRTLCGEVDPTLSKVPERQPEPLPSVPELAQLREALKTFPLPYPVHIERALKHASSGATHEALAVPLGAARSSMPTTPRVGRNERCPCGSGRKWKRCCGARRP